MAISPSSLLISPLHTYSRERRREGEEEEEEEEEKEIKLGGLEASTILSFSPFGGLELAFGALWWINLQPRRILDLGRSLQAGTPEIAIRDTYSPCGIGRRSGLPWARLIPRVGMMTTMGPLGSAPARQPTGGSQGHRQPSGGSLQI
uniref:Uncharacterized protein n=1 Tax=Ananas comosus var. bracteatus TaxID=296719 RepID=A0A6V7P917_ANACO|nr:unnamed protein product [Ananas comosus var. bracteatus]